jgi:nitrile hydratase subunit beta
MNGIHDLGGMHGFGPVNPETDEPVFHADWEARALALTLAMAAHGKWNIDASRHARERIPPADYLRFSYYERWIAGLITLMREHGLVTDEEIASGNARGKPQTPPLRAEQVRAVLERGGPTTREIDVPPRYTVGQSVRARNLHPAGHIRLPRYVRGHQGEIVLHHGAHVFPDANAHFKGEQPQHLYTVRFSARELWGPEASARDTVSVDLWESYLEPA